jgi:hypothetical protein
VALASADARYHAHLIGPTGRGKSTLLETFVLSDAERGQGVVYIDIKGDSVYRLLRRLPRSCWDRVVLLDPAQLERVVGLNVLEHLDPARRGLVADQVVAIFRRLFHQYWKDRSDDVMQTAVRTLLEHPGTTICDVPALLLDERVRARLTRGLRDPVLAASWQEWNGWSPKERLERAGPVLTRLRTILLRPEARNILGQSKSTIRLDEILDEGGILLVSLAKGVIGEETARLLGSLLMVQLWQATLRRANRPEAERPDASVIVDEFHNFVHLPGLFSDLLSESRGYHVGWFLAHQFMAQLQPPALLEAVLANTQTTIAYAPKDHHNAAALAPLLQLTPTQLMSLAQHQIASRLCIDGHPSRTFTVRTQDVPASLGEEHAEALTQLALERKGRPRAEVESEILARLRGTSQQEMNPDDMAS